jgi:anti-sigma B factor antagonist
VAEREEVLTVAVDHVGYADVVAVGGVLDVFTAPELRAVLSSAGPCHAPHLVLDLRALTFLDSIGIGTIVAGRRLCAARGGRTVVVAVQGTLAHKILHLVALHKVLEISPSLESALELLHLDDTRVEGQLG